MNRPYKYSIILLLLIFASSYSGLAQSDALKPGLTDQEVLQLRNELVEAVQNDSIGKAKKIGVLLWKTQANEGNYIYIGEYFSTLFLSNDFDEILAMSAEKQHQLNLQPEFIDGIIKQKLMDSKQDILSAINNQSNPLDRIHLRSMLNQLTQSQNFTSLKENGSTSYPQGYREPTKNNLNESNYRPSSSESLTSTTLNSEVFLEQESGIVICNTPNFSRVEVTNRNSIKVWVCFLKAVFYFR